MSDSPFQKVILKDPLSEETRKERRNLLAISALGITMVKTGLIPTKIAALGVEFSQTDRNVLLNVLAVIAIYFLTAFIFYALSDYWSYRLEKYLSQIKYLSNRYDVLTGMITSLKEVQNELVKLKSDHEQSINELREANKKYKELIGDADNWFEELKVTGKDKLPDDSTRAIASDFRLRESQLDALYLKQDAITEELTNKFKELEIKNMVEVGVKKDSIRSEKFLTKRAQTIASFRLLFEFVVPLCVGIYAIVTLFIKR